MANSPIGGALPAQMPGAVGKGDKVVIKSTTTKIAAAMKATKDPELKALFSSALSDLHTHLAQDSKARKAGTKARVAKTVAEPKPKKK